MEKILNFDCVIIGAGPAGLSASIYLKRANLNVLVIEKNIPGGQINYASVIENYPGYSSISGSELANNMFKQAEELEVQFMFTEVIEVREEDNFKIVKTIDDEIATKNIVIASGRVKKDLGIPNEDSLVGRGISYCALCDGRFFKDKNIVVIGGGNSAVMEAIHLSNIVNHITIIHRSSSFKAESILCDELNELKNIDIKFDTFATRFIEKDGILNGVSIKNKITNVEETLEVSGAFIYIGYVPNIDIYKSLNINNENGYILVNDRMETNAKGVYACGDIINKHSYQIVSAAAEGMEAANNIIEKR